MLLDKFQMDQTRQRFNANAQKRTQNEKLIREGKLLQVDTPERVSKFLARRGLIRSTRGLELSGGLQPAGEELAGSGGGEAFERIMGTSDLMGIAFLERGLQIARSVGRVWVNVEVGKAEAYGTGFPRLVSFSPIIMFWAIKPSLHVRRSSSITHSGPIASPIRARCSLWIRRRFILQIGIWIMHLSLLIPFPLRAVCLANSAGTAWFKKKEKQSRRNTATSFSIQAVNESS